MPFIFGLIASGAVGAWTLLSKTPDPAPATTSPLAADFQKISPIEVAYYAVIAMGLFWVATKTGVTKELTKVL